MHELVFPKNNEKELIERSYALGFTHLILAYDSIDILKTAQAAIKEHTLWALHITTEKKSDIMKKIGEAQRANVFTLVPARDNLFNRFIIEKTNTSILYNPEYVHPKDHIHFRRSGLDQVLCTFAAKKNKTIATSLASLKRAKDKPLILGRIMQNIEFCQKYDVPYTFFSFAKHQNELKGAHDIKSLLTTLKMSSGHKIMKTKFS